MMKDSKEKKLLFCFTIYVLIFIAIAFYPPNRNIFATSPSIITTLYKSNLIIPFLANTILTIYFFKKNKEAVTNKDF